LLVHIQIIFSASLKNKKFKKIITPHSRPLSKRLLSTLFVSVVSC
jgi:hypothetical protein